MKIFSNFDSNRKKEAIKELEEKYWKKNLLILNKSFLFLLVKVILPVIWGLLIYIGVVILSVCLFWWVENVWIYIVSWIWFVIYLIFIYPSLKYYIDYRMDFSIVTQDFLTRYNQTGFFKRDIKSSNVNNIKTITIDKNNILYNIFNNWDLIFMSEWGREKDWEIVLHYIKNPEKVRKDIVRIMKL